MLESRIDEVCCVRLRALDEHPMQIAERVCEAVFVPFLHEQGLDALVVMEVLSWYRSV